MVFTGKKGGLLLGRLNVRVSLPGVKWRKVLPVGQLKDWGLTFVPSGRALRSGPN